MPSIRNIRRKRRAQAIIWSTIFAGMACLAAFKLPSTLRAQVATPPTVTPLGSLKGVNTPKLTNVEAFLKTDRFGNHATSPGGGHRAGKGAVLGSGGRK
jgi:hypothetical protein